MIHWPTPFDWRSTDTWKAFVKLRDEGMARTLGVCNFMPADLKRLHEETGAWPAVNQIELHPTWQQREVVAFCKEHGIAWRPTRRWRVAPTSTPATAPSRRSPPPMSQPGPGDSALAHRKRHDHHPKSVHADRQRENLDLFASP